MIFGRINFVFFVDGAQWNKFAGVMFSCVVVMFSEIYRASAMEKGFWKIVSENKDINHL